MQKKMNFKDLVRRENFVCESVSPVKSAIMSLYGVFKASVLLLVLTLCGSLLLKDTVPLIQHFYYSLGLSVFFFTALTVGEALAFIKTSVIGSFLLGSPSVARHHIVKAGVLYCLVLVFLVGILSVTRPSLVLTDETDNKLEKCYDIVECNSLTPTDIN
jgi:hypothetical protein